jgi:hypothetical protein
MDYEATLLELDSIEGGWTVVYSAPGGNATEPGDDFMTGALSASGVFKRDRKGETGGAGARRMLVEAADWYRDRHPDLDVGDAPLELYERQAAHFTFEGMDDAMGSFRPGTAATNFAGFTLWRDDFVDAEWLEYGIRPHWLWIRTAHSGVVVVAEFPSRASGAE